MSAVVWCRLCGHKSLTHVPTLAVEAHTAPWDRVTICPGSGRPGLTGVAS